MLFFVNTYFTITTIMPVFLLIFFILEVLFLRKEKIEYQKALLALQDSSGELIEQSSLYYNNALLASEIGEILTKQINKSNLLKKVVEIFKERLDYDRGLILMTDKKRSCLEYKNGYGYTEEQYELIENTSFHLDKADSKGVFVLCYKEKKSFLVNDIHSIQSDLSERSLEFAKKLQANSFICCPIINEDKVYGVLAVDNIQTKRPLVERDVNLLVGIAHFIGISLHNIELIESKQRQFESLLRVLAASIDARDPLTAGHSEKVTEYSLAICDELGMDQESKYLIRVAALLHDYGKIGVPDAILKKPDRLTSEEYEIVKTHAIKTKQILEQISFEGVLEQVPLIAASHHERIDGSGYPCGLKGKEIPWEAQIIAVADFFEAITAKRHYRDPMPLHVAFDLLFEKSGIHFDPKIVNALYSFYKKNYGDDFLKEEKDTSRKTVGKLTRITKSSNSNKLQSLQPRQQITGVYEKRRG
jgi:putative nucleotidyltransferase with HDIG domain